MSCNEMSWPRDSDRLPTPLQRIISGERVCPNCREGFMHNGVCEACGYNFESSKCPKCNGRMKSWNRASVAWAGICQKCGFDALSLQPAPPLDDLGRYLPCRWPVGVVPGTSFSEAAQRDVVDWMTRIAPVNTGTALREPGSIQAMSA